MKDVTETHELSPFGYIFPERAGSSKSVMPTWSAQTFSAVCQMEKIEAFAVYLYFVWFLIPYSMKYKSKWHWPPLCTSSELIFEGQSPNKKGCPLVN